jgi:hypothetical protein
VLNGADTSSFSPKNCGQVSLRTLASVAWLADVRIDNQALNMKSSLNEPFRIKDGQKFSTTFGSIFRM